MAKVNVPGHTGLLSMYLKKAYKPVVCLSSTSMSRVSTLIEKVNYCTQGLTISKIDKVEKSVKFEGEIVTAEDADAVSTFADLVTAQDSKQEQIFKLEGRGAQPIYFAAVISNLDDTFKAGEDATFTGTLTINGETSTNNPHEGD